jgi:hypothetical protein
MIKPELFDVIELLVNLPDHNQFIGNKGTIVEDFEDGQYEVEFANEQGETLALCTLSTEQFIVVWQAQTKKWVSVSEKLTEIIHYLPESKKQEVLNFARFLHQLT